MPAVVPALDAKGSTAIEILNDTDTAVLVINGGYFDREQDGTLKPTGLLIAEGKILSPLTACRACSGLLWVKDGEDQLMIDWAKGIVPDSSIESAVQTGPLLVEPGGKLGIANPGGPKAERSAICLSKVDSKNFYPNVTVVAVTSRITLYEFAVLLQRPSPGGFDCERAINLDGGPSTQIAARFGDFIVRQESYGTASHVQNFIAFYAPK